MKCICVGRNYAEHIEELNNKHPDSPVLFIKPDTAVLKDKVFYIPEFSDEVHYELEILIKIKKGGKHIAPEFAHKYYSEVGLGIDFTARDLQLQLKEKGLPWEKAKAFDNSALVSEWVPKTTIADLNAVSFSLLKNNSIVQNSNTNLMLWKIDELISYISTFFTLKTGDIIFTGTPSGVGKVSENDILKGYIEDKEYFSVTIK